MIRNILMINGLNHITGDEANVPSLNASPLYFTAATGNEVAYEGDILDIVITAGYSTQPWDCEIHYIVTPPEEWLTLESVTMEGSMIFNVTVAPQPEWNYSDRWATLKFTSPGCANVSVAIQQNQYPAT